jgi:hypothetical protein
MKKSQLKQLISEVVSEMGKSKFTPKNPPLGKFFADQQLYILVNTHTGKEVKIDDEVEMDYNGVKNIDGAKIREIAYPNPGMIDVTIDNETFVQVTPKEIGCKWARK